MCITLVLGLAGCTAAAPQPPVLETPEPTAPPAPTAPPVIANGVVGGATIADVDLTVIHLDGGYAFGGLSAQDGSLTLLLTPAEVSAGGCLDGEFTGFSAGGSFPDTEVLVTDTQYGGDLTFFRTAALVDTVDTVDASGPCWYRVIAAGPISWAIPPLYVDLVVADAGEASGALGAVTLDGSTLVSYAVHRGDVLAEIAARFGLTTPQLLWLNPRRAYASPVARTDEILNLAEARR